MTSKISHYHSVTKKRSLRVRSKLFGSADQPRITVFRSNKHVSVQVINDELGVTLLSGTDLGKRDLQEKSSKVLRASKVGSSVGKAMVKKGLKKAVFDRGPYRYHGRVKAIAEAIRKEGISV